MLRRSIPFGRVVLEVSLLCALIALSRALAQPPPEPIAVFEQTLATAERALRDGGYAAAENQYRSALLQGWILVGQLKAADGQLAEARDAFETASVSSDDNRHALEWLALTQLQMHQESDAIRILSPLAAEHPTDLPIRQLLTQALVATGQAERAVDELERVHRQSPTDPELTFLLASGYLSLKRVEAAEPLFAAVVAARPLAETYVLLGRTYRDAGEYDRARTALQSALQKNPRVRRAHYYLGSVDVIAEGMAGLDDAIVEFQRELALAPADPIVNLRLGMALVEGQRAAAALPALTLATQAPSAPPTAWLYLGRCQLALNRANDAVTSLERALELSKGVPADAARTGNIHYLLGRALRAAGRSADAAGHFAEAERSAATRADTSRARLTRYLADTADPPSVPSVLLDAPIQSPTAPPERRALTERLARLMAGAYLNLGVMRAQQERFSDAIDWLQRAARLDPAAPRVQYSLGVACFNAKQYAQAVEPLTRALESSPTDAGIRRMLAMSAFNTGDFGKAAELLRADPTRDTDAGLQYVYGVALVRSDHAADAQAIFERLLTEHGDSAELSVVLGQALAQQGDYDAAIQSLQRAVSLQANVADALAALGVIYLRQGRFAEAEQALRAELTSHPEDFKTQHNLAMVLELEGARDEAVTLLREVLQRQPEFVDARYLLGKVLLAQGLAQEAVEQLEMAVRLAPEEANVHYQLGQAYQKLGRAEIAQQHFETFRQLKDKRRGSRS